MSTHTFYRALLVVSSLLVAAALTPRDAIAQWSTDPTVNSYVSRDYAQEQHPLAVSDGADGVIVVWQYYSFGYHLRAQRVNAGGARMWDPTGVNGVDVVSTSSSEQSFHQVMSDGAGGVIVVWNDNRSATGPYEVYAQRLDASGTRLWGADGTPICVQPEVQAYPQLTTDGAGGAIIAWRDSRSYGASGVNIYAQRISAAGAVQWTANGVPVCTAGGDQRDPAIVSDGSGGAVVAWMDDRTNGTPQTDVYMQRINSAGAAQWVTDGVGYQTNSNQTWYPGQNPIASDGAGGAMIFWHDDYYGSSDIDIRGLRVNASGAFPWSPSSVIIAGADSSQYMGQIASDGAGNVVVPWTSYEYGVSDPDIGALKLSAAPLALWPGTQVCLNGSPQKYPVAVMDAFGGAIIAWRDERNTDDDIYAQRFDAPGAYQWTYNGIEVSTATNAQDSPAITLAGTCGAIVAFRDLRWVGDPFDDTDWDIYGQRIYCNGTLINRWITLDTPNGGESWQAGTEQTISWHGDGIDNVDVEIRCSTNGGTSYDFVAYKTNHGTSGSYIWEVPDTPSTQCIMRVFVQGPPEGLDVSDAEFTITAPVAVEDLPAPDHLMLRQAYPNPARTEVTLPFGLPSSEHVRLSVYDVRGRLVRVIENGMKAPGWHVARWDRTARNGSRVPTGVYYFELHTDGSRLTQKTIVLD